METLKIEVDDANDLAIKLEERAKHYKDGLNSDDSKLEQDQVTKYEDKASKLTELASKVKSEYSDTLEPAFTKVKDNYDSETNKAWLLAE